MGNKKKRQKRNLKTNRALAGGGYIDWTLDGEGRLVAIDEIEHRLSIEGPDGKFTFLGKKGAGPGEFNYPRSIEILNGIAYVVDSWNHRVQLFELPSWKFKEAFGGGGDGPGQFFCPSWITVVDREEGRPWLLVADTNNRRLSFHDTEGNYLFASELFHPSHPTKVRMREGAIEVQYENGQWELAY